MATAIAGTATEADIKELNTLLRGELSAVETYEQAITKFTDPTTVEAVAEIISDHRGAVRTLHERIRSSGGEAVQGSGLWGSFAKLVTGTAKLLGPQTALAALREGEAHGIAEYERAITNEDLSEETLMLIRGDLLPQCREHLPMLDEEMKKYA